MILQDTVVLRLEIDYLKQSMIQHVQLRHLEVEQKIKSACDNFLASGQLEKIINDEFSKVVQEEIKNYFQYGEGYQSIREAVKTGFSKRMKKKKTEK